MRPCARPGCTRNAYGVDYACSECDGLLPEPFRTHLHTARASHRNWAEKHSLEQAAQEHWKTLEPGHQLGLPEPQEAA